VLRDGPWLEAPRTVDRTTVRRPTPEAFSKAVSTPTIEVVPIVKAGSSWSRPGWCTYSDAFDSPETEVLCGGVNAKTATAAAVWRQGHLLHFGFDLAPDEMSEAGRALLVNGIAYIARFTEDRPITHAPGRALVRVGADRVTAQAEPETDYVEWYFTPAVRQAGKASDWPAFQAWYKKHRDFLRADRAQRGSLVLDEEALDLGIAPGRPEFFPAALAALAEGGRRAEQAGALLRRYAPDGPAGTGADEWRTWWEGNKPHLFFSESGWYRWYIDPLAKARGVPSASLRGPLRASRAGG
jgi:hypothetical protein